MTTQFWISESLKLALIGGFIYGMLYFAPVIQEILLAVKHG